MLRTIGLLALPRRALSAGSDDGISPAAARLLGGWDLTETGLAPASPTQLIWTHRRLCPTRCGRRSMSVDAVPGQRPSVTGVALAPQAARGIRPAGSHSHRPAWR